MFIEPRLLFLLVGSLAWTAFAAPPQLFDLNENVAEEPDVAARHADVVRRLADAARKLREETQSAKTHP